MKKWTYLIITCFLMSCQAQETPTLFTQSALNDTFIDYNGQNIKLKNILENYKGKTIFIDVWASWCRDCIEGLPQLERLQKENKEVVFLFLSLDKDIPRWKRGIEKHQIKGEHYFMKSGWDGAFGDFLELDWIPRYLVVDKAGAIKVYKSIKLTDNKLLNALL